MDSAPHPFHFGLSTSKWFFLTLPYLKPQKQAIPLAAAAVIRWEESPVCHSDSMSCKDLWMERIPTLSVMMNDFTFCLVFLNSMAAVMIWDKAGASGELFLYTGPYAPSWSSSPHTPSNASPLLPQNHCGNNPRHWTQGKGGKSTVNKIELPCSVQGNTTIGEILHCIRS